MKYRVLKYFTDLQDNRHAYHVGETFPRVGLEVSPERIEALSTDKNKRGIPLIEKIEEEPLPFTEDDPVEEVAEAKPKSQRGKKRG